jgi:hypothetical protein
MIYSEVILSRFYGENEICGIIFGINNLFTRCLKHEY